MSPWGIRRYGACSASDRASTRRASADPPSRSLYTAFEDVRKERGLSLLEVYVDGRQHEELYQLAELLTEWDERVGLWRYRHFQVVARIIGEDVVGTQGTPVELLAGLIKNRMFPELWRVRTELTELAKQSD